MWIYIYKHTYIYIIQCFFAFFIIFHCWFHYILLQFSFNICRFLINVVRLCKPLSKLDLPTLLKGSTEESTQRKIWHSLGLEPRSPAFLVPMPYPLYVFPLLLLLLIIILLLCTMYYALYYMILLTVNSNVFRLAALAALYLAFRFVGPRPSYCSPSIVTSSAWQPWRRCTWPSALSAHNPRTAHRQ